MMDDSSALVDRLRSRCEESASASAIDQRRAEMLTDALRGYPETPICHYEVTIAGRRRSILLKLEGHSPWHSIKGRTAIGLLTSALHELAAERRIVESTSGNLGVAIAALSAMCGLRFSAIVDDRLPHHLRETMWSFGAEIITVDTPDGDGLLARLDRARELADADPAVLWLNQYENPANPAVHELWTGPEILRQVPQTQAVFVGVSTGGTLAGIARAVRAAGSPCAVVAVDVAGSSAITPIPGLRSITGIGASTPAAHVDASAYDAFEAVESSDAVTTCHVVLQATGHALGGSSGAVVAACLRRMEHDPGLRHAVCLCPDLGDSYADTIYNPDWVARLREATRD
jgi:cysteine synthase A